MQELAIREVREPERRVPVVSAVDVLVVGGGPAGLMAALAAAEGKGVTVALVEHRPFVGGNLTIGLPVLGFLSQKGTPIIAGLPQKFIDRLTAVGGASPHRPCPLHMSLTLIEPEAVKTVGLEMLAESGVDVMLYSQFSVPLIENGVLKGVIVEGKAGRTAILAKVVIDCTGDADVAFRSGVPCEKGNEEGGMQPPTLMFCLAGVDTDRLRLSIANDPGNYTADFIPNDYFGRNRQFIVVGLRRQIEQAKADGLSIPTERTIIITGLKEGEAWINMTRVKGVDGTDPLSLTYGEIEARRQIGEIVKYLTRYIPGFENCRLTKTAPFLGIRETRRIVGRYVLNREDILSCRRFDDAIAVASYPIDLHRPNDEGCTLEWCGDCYDIPYRCLLPLGIENLLVAGRCISTTHEAMAAIRVMATCMAMGEAAGRAARMAVAEGVSPSQIDVEKLQSELLAKGAYLRA